VDFLKKDFKRFPQQLKAAENDVSNLQLHLSWTKDPQT
jgi:hypothetical protein